MDNVLHSLNSAYQDLHVAAIIFLEAKETLGGQNFMALENLMQKLVLFSVECDQVDEYVETVKQRIGSECLVDEATGSIVSKPGQPVRAGLAPISAVRLQQMSEAVRLLLIELQQGLGSGGRSLHGNNDNNARFTEDAAQ